MKKILLFVLMSVIFSMTTISQTLSESNAKSENKSATYHSAISNSVQTVDANINFNDYAVPTKNSTAKLVNQYLNNRTSIDLPEFHSNQARVKYYILSGAFVGLLTVFIVNLIKVNNS